VDEVRPLTSIRSE
jgi:transposase InsO family protein